MIVVGLDGSTHSFEALAWALQYARRAAARVEVVHATPVVLEPAALSDPLHLGQLRVERMLRQALAASMPGGGPGVEVVARAVPGRAAPVLLDAAESAELLVLGHRGRDGFPGLSIGSVSQQCTAHASCPVVVVRPREAVATG